MAVGRIVAVIVGVTVVMAVVEGGACSALIELQIPGALEGNHLHPFGQ